MSVRRAMKRAAKAPPYGGKGVKVGDMLFTQTYALRHADGVIVGLFWFSVPDGMTAEEAFNTQQHYGPFGSDAEVKESQRVTLLGEQCEVTEGGMWDPAWDRPQ
ncbi:MAG: hypothetical protein WAV38_08485 [Xanthobacteraceae bacterium]